MTTLLYSYSPLESACMKDTESESLSHAALYDITGLLKKGFILE
ncbi:hypothetical protein [Paenibacillus sp. JMULE4]|nr:hypothetical protein [Paenibacillus sp. JMULE4]